MERKTCDVTSLRISDVRDYVPVSWWGAEEAGFVYLGVWGRGRLRLPPSLREYPLLAAYLQS